MTDTIPPILFDWDGESMKPRQPKIADRYYVVGESYRLVPHEDRSQSSHNHFFATVADAHSNLPEHMAQEFPTPEHLRKRALIQAGYRDERTFVASSKAEAIRIATFMRPKDDFALIVVNGPVVTEFTAKSQSKKAMGAKVFQESKDAVLRALDELLGVEAGTVAKEAGKAA